MCYLPIKKMKKTVIIVFLSPFFKYLLKFLISPFVDGIPSLDQLAEDLYSYLISGGLEVIQYALVMLVMLKPSKKHRDGRMMGDADSVRSPLVPFSRILSLKNPLQLGALASAAVYPILRSIRITKKRSSDEASVITEALTVMGNAILNSF